MSGRNPSDLIEKARAAALRRGDEAETLAALGLSDPTLRRAVELIALLGGHSGRGTEELMAEEGLPEPRMITAQLERLGILELGSRPLEDRVLNPLISSLMAARGE